MLTCKLWTLGIDLSRFRRGVEPPPSRSTLHFPSHSTTLCRGKSSLQIRPCACRSHKPCWFVIIISRCRTLVHGYCGSICLIAKLWCYFSVGSLSPLCSARLYGVGRLATISLFQSVILELRCGNKLKVFMAVGIYNWTTFPVVNHEQLRNDIFSSVPSAFIF